MIKSIDWSIYKSNKSNVHDVILKSHMSQMWIKIWNKILNQDENSCYDRST